MLLFSYVCSNVATMIDVFTTRWHGDAIFSMCQMTCAIGRTHMLGFLSLVGDALRGSPGLILPDAVLYKCTMYWMAAAGKASCKLKAKCPACTMERVLEKLSNSVENEDCDRMYSVNLIFFSEPLYL